MTANLVFIAASVRKNTRTRKASGFISLGRCASHFLARFSPRRPSPSPRPAPAGRGTGRGESGPSTSLWRRGRNPSCPKIEMRTFEESCLAPLARQIIVANMHLRSFFLCGLVFVAPLALRAEDPAFWSWAKTPPMGWNSWDGFATTVTEAQTRAQADFMAAHLLPRLGIHCG